MFIEFIYLFSIFVASMFFLQYSAITKYGDDLNRIKEFLWFIWLRRHNWMHFSKGYTVLSIEFKLKYLEKIKLFSIRLRVIKNWAYSFV